jgi:hypothetical protein
MPYAPHPARLALTAQLELPATPAQRAALGAKLAPLLTSESSLLLVADDWAHYAAGEMDRLDAIRRESGETRPLLEAPGHLFREPEQLRAARLASLLLGFPSRWSFYLYGLSSPFTLLFWEGDLLDVWAPRSLAAELGRLLSPRGSSGPPA